MAKNIQSEFVKYYKDKLEPLGFRKVKGRQPYFVRVVNDEILHVITISGTTSAEQGYKAFILRGGVISVYRKEINFSVTPLNNSDWLIPLSMIYEKRCTCFPIVSIPRNPMVFYFTDETATQAIEEAASDIDNLIKIIEKIQTMDNLFIWNMYHTPFNVRFDGWNTGNMTDEEGLYYLLKSNAGEKLNVYYDHLDSELSNSLLDSEEKDEEAVDLLKWKNILLSRIQNFYSSPNNYKLGVEILKKQYDKNLSGLAKCGIQVKRKDLPIEHI